MTHVPRVALQRTATVRDCFFPYCYWDSKRKAYFLRVSDLDQLVNLLDYWLSDRDSPPGRSSVSSLSLLTFRPRTANASPEHRGRCWQVTSLNAEITNVSTVSSSLVVSFMCNSINSSFRSVWTVRLFNTILNYWVCATLTVRLIREWLITEDVGCIRSPFGAATPAYFSSKWGQLQASLKLCNTRGSDLKPVLACTK